MVPERQELFRNGCTVQAGHPFFHSHLHNSKYWRFRLLQKWNGLIQEENEKNARRELTKTFGEKEGSYIKTKEYKVSTLLCSFFLMMARQDKWENNSPLTFLTCLARAV